ncbi:MAG TPA: response regulator [Aliidongia sp.]|nr:response regulator [Aliidongia sp.]
MNLSVQRHVLVVEDDESYRRLVVRMLESAGYRVTAAGDFAAAMAVIDGPEAIDLLLTDVGMPPGTPHGVSIGSVAQLKRRELRLIYMSGGFDPTDFVLHDEAAMILRKPFTVSELTEAVRQTLG